MNEIKAKRLASKMNAISRSDRTRYGAQPADGVNMGDLTIGQPRWRVIQYLDGEPVGVV